MKEFDEYDLDTTDIRLITELEVDAKQSYLDLAAKLGLSRQTVQSRLERLLDSKVIKIVCSVDPVAIGYNSEVVLALNTYPDKLMEVVESLRSYEGVHFISLCTGRFDIIAWATFREHEQLSHFLIQELRALPGIVSVESMLRLRPVKVSTTLFANGRILCAQEPDPDLDALDRKLIAELQSDAQASFSAVASRLGTSEATVFRRIKKMLTKGIIKVVAVVNLKKLGYSSMATIGLTVDASRINEIADKVASYRNVRTVATFAGRYDIIAWVVMRDIADLARFVDSELAKIDGLNRIETMATLEVVKLTTRFTP